MPTDKDPPLMSSSSPSYERAREEAKHPSDVRPAQALADLERLYEAEDNARVANLRAAESLTDPTEARARAGGHAQKQEALAQQITLAGGSAPRDHEIRAVLAHGVADIDRANDDAERNAALALIEQDLAALYK